MCRRSPEPRRTIFLVMGVGSGVRASNLSAMRRWIALAAFMVVAACNQPGVAVTGPADVAVQQGDLPKSVQKCSASGDIDSFLNTVKAKDPTTYTSTKAEWDKAKSNGASSAEVVFFTDSKAHCDSIFGFSESTITSTAAAGVTKGTATGLGTNSVTLLIAIANQSFFVAVWQNKTFMVILAVINVDSTQSKKVASNENSRIK